MRRARRPTLRAGTIPSLMQLHASRQRLLLIAMLGILLCWIAVARGQTVAPSAKAASKAAPTRYLPNRFAGRAGIYYKVVWGIDDLKVKWAESGEIVRVSWHVLDPQLAQILNDKKAQPSLIDPQAGVSLVIPAVENIGQLRQTQPPEADKSYWMAFSNKGRMVKRGDRVDLVVGTFRAQGLVVD